MKFLVDAHLPPSLCQLLEAAGHEAIHTLQLAARNRTSDEAINRLSVSDHRIVISKDGDFYHSLLLRREHWKVLLVRTGNIGARDLRELFSRHLPAIITALETNSLVELDRASVRIVS